jgi:hypothetical protein
MELEVFHCLEYVTTEINSKDCNKPCKYLSPSLGDMLNLSIPPMSTSLMCFRFLSVSGVVSAWIVE